MTTAICIGCASDVQFKNFIEQANETHTCSQCRHENVRAITVKALASRVVMIMRDHFVSYEQYGEDDPELTLSDVILAIVGRTLQGEEELKDEVLREGRRLYEDEIPFWNRGMRYLKKRIESWDKYSEWTTAQNELKESRRFFSPAAQALFSDLFSDFDNLNSQDGISVVSSISVGTKLFRARECPPGTDLTKFFQNPFKEVGPPPAAFATAGRMNAEGVPVFYGSLDGLTALSELRPAMGTDLVRAEFKVTTPLRVLDFSRFASAKDPRPLSYFQSDYSEQAQKRHFRQRLGNLIAQPVHEKRKADYLITQAMAEYLSHVATPQFQAISFKSAQSPSGTNVVVFSIPGSRNEEGEANFPLEYVDESIGVHRTRAVQYTHEGLDVFEEDGRKFTWEPDLDFGNWLAFKSPD